MSSSLRLNRLIVMCDGKRVYDEKFHSGLNIIRGTNGSGKSTIMDFIFFALGGELKDWKEHALLCTNVIAEITASGRVIVVKREVSQKQKRPIQVFWGSFEEASKSAVDGWIHAPFSRSDNSKSFTQILFEALNLPEIPGDAGSNITMHQMLRLMYVDQATPFQRIFRLEPHFDTKDIRRAVGELLCGIGGYELYAAKINHRVLNNKFNENKTKLDNLFKVTAALGQSVSEEGLDSDIHVMKSNREKLYREFKDLESGEINEKTVAKDSEVKRKNLFIEMTSRRDEIIDLEEKLKSIEYEMSDSENFITHIKNLLREFESSALTYRLLGSVKFSRCPSCHSELPVLKAGACHLCGGKQTEEEIQSKTLSVKLDLEGQLIESKRLLEDRLGEAQEIANQLKSSRRHLSRLSNNLEAVSNAPVDGRSALLFDISRQIGQADARLEELEKFRSLSEEVSTLSQQKSRLQEDISKVEDKINELVKLQEKRRKVVRARIIEKTKQFLDRDLQRHKDVDSLDDFAFDFEDDWFAVNGQPNISKSASGMVVIKNSLFLGMLFSSLDDTEMRFPKFLLLDNVEDKGMVDERIKNFQEVIADFSDNSESAHQIILTTSSINEALDIDNYTIGDFYTVENRSLNFNAKL